MNAKLWELAPTWANYLSQRQAGDYIIWVWSDRIPYPTRQQYFKKTRGKASRKIEPRPLAV